MTGIITPAEQERIEKLRAAIAQVSGTEWKVEAIGPEFKALGAPYVYSPHLGGIAMVPPGSPMRSAGLFYPNLIAQMRNDVPMLLDIIDRQAREHEAAAAKVAAHVAELSHE